MTSTNTTIQTRHDRRITVEHRDENTILEVTNTSTGRVLGAGLNPAEARQIAAALTGQAGPWSLPDLMWLRTDLANQAGQWTRDDLPCVADLVKASVDAMATELGGGADAALDAVVDHLNTHHPKPGQSVCAQSDNDEPMMPRETLRERTASDGRLWNQAYAEGVASAERTCNELRSLIEGQKEHVTKAQRERDDEKSRSEFFAKRADEARRERDAAVARAEQAENARDTAATRAEQMEKEVGKWRTATESAHSDFLQAAHERDEWKARAEQAERERDEWHQRAENTEWGMGHPDRRWSEEDLEAEVRRRTQCLRENLHGVTRSRDEWERRFHDLNHDLIDREMPPAPAVTRADIENAIRTAFNQRGGGYTIWHVEVPTAGVCELLGIGSEAVVDPAVHVVRESDLPMVSRGEDEHWRDEGGKYVVWGTHTLESAKANVKIQLRHAAEFEAVARAIEAEAAVDPVEKKARELAAAGGIDFDEQEPDGVEMLIGMARHVLGQEATR